MSNSTASKKSVKKPVTVEDLKKAVQREIKLLSKEFEVQLPKMVWEDQDDSSSLEAVFGDNEHKFEAEITTKDGNEPVLTMKFDGKSHEVTPPEEEKEKSRWKSFLLWLIVSIIGGVLILLVIWGVWTGYSYLSAQSQQTGTHSATVKPGTADPAVAKTELLEKLTPKLAAAKAALESSETAAEETWKKWVEWKGAKTTAGTTWTNEQETKLTEATAAHAKDKAKVEEAEAEVEDLLAQISGSGGGTFKVVKAVNSLAAGQVTQTEVFERKLGELGTKVETLTTKVEGVTTAVNEAKTGAERAAADAKQAAAQLLAEQQRTTAAIKSLEKRISKDLAKSFVEITKIQVSTAKVDAVNETLNKLLGYAEKHKNTDLQFVQDSLTAIKEQLIADAKARETAAKPAAAPAPCYIQYSNGRFCR